MTSNIAGIDNLVIYYVNKEEYIEYGIKDANGVNKSVIYDEQNIYGSNASDVVKKFAAYIRQINNCLYDESNRIVVYHNYSAPFQLKVLNNGEDITENIWIRSEDAIRKEKSKLYSSLIALESQFLSVTSAISLKKRKEADGGKFETSINTSNIDIIHLALEIKNYLDKVSGNNTAVFTGIIKFYDSLLSLVDNGTTKCFIDLHYSELPELQCPEIAVLRKVVLNAILMLESYKNIYLNSEKADHYDILRKINVPGLLIEEAHVSLKVDDYFKKEKEQKEAIFKQLSKTRREILTSDERKALVLYKICFFREINKIVRFLRKNNVTLAEANTISEYQEYISNVLKDGYASYMDGVSIDTKFANENGLTYKEYLDGSKIKSPRYANNPNFNKQNPKSVINALKKFENNGYVIPSYTDYSNIILNSIPLIESALKKCELSDDIVVYRGIANHECNLENDHSFLSTTSSFQEAEKFSKMEDRSNKGVLESDVYKMIIPKGSTVICFSNDLLNDNRDDDFDESQKEILIDSDNFDLELIDSQGYNTEEKAVFSPVYRLRPKSLNEELNAGRGR